jgi:hypothetical protein
MKATPHRDFVFELAETMADQVGFSIVFSGTPDSEGEFSLARCTEIYSCDIVDQPGANPTGMFSAVFDTNHTNNMTIETPEFLALQAEHKSLCELSTTIKTDLEAANAEKTELSAKLTDTTAKLDAASKTLTELSAKLEKQEAEHKAELAKFDEKVAAAAETKLAALGTKPVALSINPAQTAMAAKELATKLEAIKDPTEKIRFYRSNKEAIDAAYRA